ncbi:hypothetical protein D3C71_1714380 [compost metagenome]
MFRKFVYRPEIVPAEARAGGFHFLQCMDDIFLSLLLQNPGREFIRDIGGHGPCSGTARSCCKCAGTARTIQDVEAGQFLFG